MINIAFVKLNQGRHQADTRVVYDGIQTMIFIGHGLNSSIDFALNRVFAMQVLIAVIMLW